MKKRFLFLTLSLILVLSLASFMACGQVTSSGGDSKTSSSMVNTGDSSYKSDSFLTPSHSSSSDNPDDNPIESESYEITLDSSITGGSVTVGVSNLKDVKSGQTVTLSNTPNKGYKFECYSVNGLEQTENTFVMPSGGVYISAKFSKIDYTVITYDEDGGSISANKSVANYGDTIILSYSAQGGYLFKGFSVKQGDNEIKVNDNSFVMPDGNVTVIGKFELQKCTVTLVNPSDGGTLTANGHNTSFEADYGTTIELSVSLTAGSFFSSYKINNVSQTNNTFVLKEDTTVEVVFIRELNGLNNFTYDAYLNNGGNSSGNVNISGNSVTNTQGKFPFVYTQMQGDFYYETEITFNAVYNNDSYPKAGIGIECNSDILFFFIDAEHFGVDKKVAVTPARGTLFGQNDFAWDWHGGSDEWSYEFKSDYTNGNYIKLGVLKVGGLFRFFAEDKYVFSVWAPNMDDTLFLGLFAFNTGYNARNAKYSTSKTVLNNVKAYYGLLKDNNPDAIVVDGTIKDWGENLATYYGYTTGDSVSYFYSGAFKGKDAVYAVFKARVSSIVTSYTDWKNNTNVEVFVNDKHFYADFSGHMSGITDIDYGYYKDVDGSNCYILTIEAKIPYLEIGDGFSSSSDIEMRFAFCLTEQLREYFLGDDELYWIEVGCKDLTVKTDGIDYEQALAPTDKVVKTTDRMCADPFILLVGDTYYMYGTTDNSNGFRVYTSTELSSWTDRGYCFNKSYSKPVGTTNFWAPEVKYNASTGKYVMFYSAGKNISGNIVAKSGVATSDSPLGPFYDANNGTPMLYADTNNMASIDALSNGYNNQGFGTNRYVMCRTGTGSFSGSINWCWDGNSITGGKWFDTGYVNGSYVKLAVLRVGGLYRFFVDGNYALSAWMPNMDDTALVGLHAFNIGFNAKNAKVGTGNTVTNNARAYYNLNSSKNPTSVTIDGQDQDWGENLVNQYGGSSADGKKYYFASAFKGSDGVYVIYKAKASTFINNANAKENTYIEIHSNISNALLAYANGGTVGISNVHFAAYSYDNSQDILISVEAKIPYSVWNGTDSSTTVTMVFAFGAHDSAQLNTWTNSSDQFWSGWDWTQRKVTTTGYEITRETTPTDKVIKFDSLQFSDPFMLVAGGQYFMYGTVGNNGFRVFVSDDMVSWRFPQNKDFTKWGITSPKTEQYIMDNGKDGGYVYYINWSDKAWGTTNFWAPEIIYNSKTKKYLLYYTAYYPTAGCEKIGVAISDTPLGPFIDVWSGPLLYSGTNDISTKCIDASPFIDDDGNFYLYYSLTVASDGSSETWVIQLDANGYSPIGNPAFCVKCEEEWEHVDKSECACNEGAYMYKHNGKYFLTYSANTFWQPLYAVGLAIGDSPMGPFYKYEGNPIVVKEEGKSAGTGHGMIFKDNNNKLWYLFHTYRDVNKGADGGKCAMAARLWFHNGIPTIEYKNW